MVRKLSSIAVRSVTLTRFQWETSLLSAVYAGLIILTPDAARRLKKILACLNLEALLLVMGGKLLITIGLAVEPFPGVNVALEEVSTVTMRAVKDLFEHCATWFEAV